MTSPNINRSRRKVVILLSVLLGALHLPSIEILSERHPSYWQFGPNTLANAQERQQLKQSPSPSIQLKALEQPPPQSDSGGEVKVLPSRRSRPTVDIPGSKEATNYLHQHRLPYVSAQILRTPSGTLASVVLTGQVRTKLGKANAERRVGEFLGESTLPIVNQVLIEPQLTGGIRSDLVRQPLSMPNGCWRRLARRAECNSAAAPRRVRCAVPDHFHLQQVCFDGIEGGALRVRVDESRSHTYRGEIQELDPSDRVTQSGIGRIGELQSGRGFQVQLNLAPHYSAIKSLNESAEHSYDMQVLYGRRVGQTPGSIYITAAGHWSCGGQNFFNTEQSGEFVRVR